jgi:AhpD family alkylhydroperoxidase
LMHVLLPFGAVLASGTVMDEHKHLYATPSAELSRKRHELAPDIDKAFQGFSHAVFAAGALDAKTKQLIAVAVAHVTQCPYCIRGHTRAALRAGAVERELMEAIWVAAEMRAGGAFAHSTIALDVMREEENVGTKADR